MARGWESTSVEDQMAAAEAARTARIGRELTPDERERQATRMTLALSRARILQDLQVACDLRYRALLEQSLAHVDAELEALE